MPISDEILKQQLSSQQPQETGIADQIIQRHFRTTDEMSTITNKPIQEFTGEGGQGASVATHYKQAHVDNPIKKIEIYSADRFPELSPEDRMSRYKIQDGEVIFKANNGKWYSENPDMFHLKIKRFIGEIGANAPAIALGTAGEFIAGPKGAMLGAAAGESIRKNIGTYAFGEQTPMMEYLNDVTKEGILGAAGSIPGRVGIRAVRKLGGLSAGKTGLRIVKAAGKELPTIDFHKAAKLQAKYKNDFGVDLFDAQTTGSRRLLDRINLYGDMPQTADIVQAAKEIQDDQAFKAVDDFMDQLYSPDAESIQSTAVKMIDGSVVANKSIPKSHAADLDKIPMSERLNIVDDRGYVTNRGRYLTKREADDLVGKPTNDPNELIGVEIPGSDSLYAGQRVSQAAQKAIDREVGERLGRAAPLYKKAFAQNTKVDIQPHIDRLSEMIAKSPETSPRHKKLLEYKRMLHRTVIIGKGAKKRKQLIPESRIEMLDELKKSIDEFLEPKVGDAPIPKRTKSDIRAIKNDILESIDDANHNYKMARRIWGDDSDALARLTNKTKLSGIAELEGQNVTAAAKQLFQNANNSPAIMKQMRSRLLREDPQALDAALKVHLQDLFERTKGSAAGGAQDTAKIFNAFWRNTVGTHKEKRMLQAAMGGEHSAQYKNFLNLTDMLRRTASIVKKESATATRQVMLQEDKAASGLAGRLLAAQFKPLVTKRRLIWEKLTSLQTDKGMRLMAETLLDPKASQHLLKIRRMGVQSEAGIRATSTFLSLVLGGEFGRHGTDLYKSYKNRNEK